MVKYLLRHFFIYPRMIQRDALVCGSCRYSLRGHVGTYICRCPECGSVITPNTESPLREGQEATEHPGAWVVVLSCAQLGLLLFAIGLSQLPWTFWIFGTHRHRHDLIQIDNILSTIGAIMSMGVISISVILIAFSRYGRLSFLPYLFALLGVVLFYSCPSYGS
jgi:hypothetical protein